MFHGFDFFIKVSFLAYQNNRLPTKERYSAINLLYLYTPVQIQNEKVYLYIDCSDTGRTDSFVACCCSVN